MKKYQVTGRIKVELNLDYKIESETEEEALEDALHIFYSENDLSQNEVMDWEIECEEIKE